LLILCGTLSTFVAGLFYLLVKGGLEFQKIGECWKLLLFLALLTTAGSVLENVSILYVSISFNQVVKSTSPVWTMVLSW
jgi:drug/metabolite transporter (DMT)-like permease